jgi:hypothetical protein
LNKWAACDLPQFKEKLEQSPLGEVQKPARVTRVLMVALIYLLPLLLIFGVDKMLHNRRD